jgi:methylmalonyl-CoA mutase N-terminal domain/subunit
MGGMVAAIEQGFPQREIQEASYQYQKAVERKEKIIVGVNDFILEKESAIETLSIDETVAARQVARTQQVRETRDNSRCRATLDALGKAAAAGNVNMMPFVIDCVRSYATLGEICDALRAVYGTYEEPTF